MRAQPNAPLRSAALEAAAALRHAANLAELAAAGPDPQVAERHIREGIAVALTAIKPKP